MITLFKDAIIKSSTNEDKKAVYKEKNGKKIEYRVSVGGIDVKKLTELYLPLVTKNELKDINEEQILSKLWQEKEGSLEAVISRIINEAVLEYMRLDIDSTIMQMLFLNDYLIGIFMRNFEVLITNYMIHYLEDKKVKELEEDKVKELYEFAKKVDIKLTLEDLTQEITRIVA
ncbi:hypothetical protein CS063_07890 [Sporanaerobium hydrogeniformans]|uniref:Uncharacterized protein n=1 Tax=Sporanaerobium hydrogeniformans TaxID=3072179 RepID=A0AC61DD75_9FIRM|nr:hypothetical protein CS063_07890 [Sporanaerobium hydrogeniformans]